MAVNSGVAYFLCPSGYGAHARWQTARFPSLGDVPDSVHRGRPPSTPIKLADGLFAISFGESQHDGLLLWPGGAVWHVKNVQEGFEQLLQLPLTFYLDNMLLCAMLGAPTGAQPVARPESPLSNVTA